MAYSMKKADVWALGMVLYILTFNKPPFTWGHTELDLMDNICNFELSFEEREISDPLKEMLQMFLEKDSAKRALISQIKMCRFLNTHHIPFLRAESFFGYQPAFKGFTLI